MSKRAGNCNPPCEGARVVTNPSLDDLKDEVLSTGKEYSVAIKKHQDTYDAYQQAQYRYKRLALSLGLDPYGWLS